MHYLVVAAASDLNWQKILLLLVVGLLGLATLLAVLRRVNRWVMNAIPPIIAVLILLYVFVAPVPQSQYPAQMRWAYNPIQQYRHFVDGIGLWLYVETEKAGRT